MILNRKGEEKRGRGVTRARFSFSFCLSAHGDMRACIFTQLGMSSLFFFCETD